MNTINQLGATPASAGLFAFRPHDASVVERHQESKRPYVSQKAFDQPICLSATARTIVDRSGGIFWRRHEMLN